jgi:hypothetical protein
LCNVLLGATRERVGRRGRADQCAEPADVVDDLRHRAVVADPDFDAGRDQLARDVGLDVGETDDQVRLELQDLADLRAGEGRHLRLLAARARRPHGEAGDADDALLLADRVENLGRLFGQADDTARAGHE